MNKSDYLPAPTEGSRALVDALEGASYRAFPNDGGAQVLAALAELRPDLILPDMLLPEMDVFEFLARLRIHPAGATIPVIIISNLADALIDCIDPDAAKAIGVAAIVPKSSSLAVMLDQIGRHLGTGALYARTAGQDGSPKSSHSPRSP